MSSRAVRGAASGRSARARYAVAPWGVEDREL
jgi:hypothetical protein